MATVSPGAHGQVHVPEDEALRPVGEAEVPRLDRERPCRDFAAAARGFADLSGSASAMSAMRSACRSSMRNSFHLSMRLIDAREEQQLEADEGVEHARP